MSSNDEEKSLELVQRWVIAVLTIVVGGAPTAALAVYSPRLARTDPGGGIGLWVMSGVIGLLTMGAVLVIHRRRPLSPLLALGLIPTLISAYFLF